jgi:hypothetical protein
MAERKPPDPAPAQDPVQPPAPQGARPRQLAHPLRPGPNGVLVPDEAQAQAQEEHYLRINEAQRGAPLEAYAAPFVTRGQPSKWVADQPFAGVLLTEGQTVPAGVAEEPGPPLPPYSPTTFVRVRPRSEEDIRATEDPTYNREFGGPGPGSLPSRDPLVEGDPDAAPATIPAEARTDAPPTK